MPTPTPTPTQEENDLAAVGGSVVEKEYDNSGIDTEARPPDAPPPELPDPPPQIEPPADAPARAAEAKVERSPRHEPAARAKPKSDAE